MRIFLLLALSLVFTSRAFAAEIRVVSAAGLTLAVSKVVEGVRDVSVKFNGNLAKNLPDDESIVSLSDLTSASGSREASVSNSREALFPDLPSGTWQMSKPPKGLSIESVRILPRSR